MALLVAEEGHLRDPEVPGGTGQICEDDQLGSATQSIRGSQYPDPAGGVGATLLDARGLNQGSELVDPVGTDARGFLSDIALHRPQGAVVPDYSLDHRGRRSALTIAQLHHRFEVDQSECGQQPCISAPSRLTQRQNRSGVTADPDMLLLQSRAVLAAEQRPQ